MTSIVAIDSHGEDVEIIALGRELGRLDERRLALCYEGKDEESQRLFPALEALERRIREIPAKTLAGIAVKLRIAVNDDDVPGGDPLLPFDPDEKYYSLRQLALLSALADVERMTKEARA